MKKYQELENKIVELQQEVDRLKKEENELPRGFNRYACIMFLEEFDCCDLFCSFSWEDTPQGYAYWSEIHNNIRDLKPYEVPKEAIIYLQDLIIKSYQQEFESK